MLTNTLIRSPASAAIKIKSRTLRNSRQMRWKSMTALKFIIFKNIRIFLLITHKNSKVSKNWKETK